MEKEKARNRIAHPFSKQWAHKSSLTSTERRDFLSIPKWTGHLVGKMHNNSITNIDLAEELGYDKNYISMVLKGKKTPKRARERFEAAVDEIIKRKQV